jgi:hypothetical protein
MVQKRPSRGCLVTGARDQTDSGVISLTRSTWGSSEAPDATIRKRRNMSDDLDAMEESPRDTVTKEQVQKRVQDWKNRLHALFHEISDWAKKNGWQVNDGGTVRMHEELMQELDVPATEQPMLRLDRERNYALFKPKGLWVIGANGRIDLYTSKGTFIIVDLAERGAGPRWTIFRASQKRGGDHFEPEMITDLV